ncbi:MAG: hypothetical protein IKR48_12125 [Kiritimatiellae bacterium]|nr:hypothetical protein [Kiritimatiellia bacterium]
MNDEATVTPNSAGVDTTSTVDAEGKPVEYGNSVPPSGAAVNPQDEVSAMRASLSLPPGIARRFTIDELLAYAALP